MKYGRFSDDGMEFIITHPDTPSPWINYHINGRYYALVSNTGGGYSYYVSPRDSRITRRRYNSVPEDRPGRYLYIRDNSNGNYWSLTWQPVLKKLDFYECRHGLGYTRIKSSYKGIRGEVLYFVPIEEDIEIWRFNLKNTTNEVKDLTLFTYVEFCLGLALEDLVEQPNTQHYNRVYFDKEDKVIYGTKLIGVSFLPKEKQHLDEGCWGKYVFMYSTLDVVGYDCDREIFLGRYRSEENPIVVEQGKCRNSILTSGHAVGVLQHDIKLKPKEEIDFCVIMGVVDRLKYRQQTRRIINKWKNFEVIDKAFDNLREYYKKVFDKIIVNTPDPVVNRCLNIWNKYQARINFYVSRDASYFHGGLTYGMGYRDTAQDLLPMVIFEPEDAKKVIKELARNMFSNGSTYHNYFRVTNDGIITGHSDDPLWFPLAVIFYLKETADFKFLYEKEKYADGKTGTILEHCFKGIDYVWKKRSKRNIPLILNGDWNDDLNECGKKGRGESIMVAEQFCYILKEMIELFKFLKKYPEKIREYEKRYRVVKDAVNKYCWDGEWYIRATTDDGEPIGSKKNKEGKIDHCAQSWAVISGISDEERSRKCLESCIKLLDTKYGLQLCAPAYQKPSSKIGASTREAPGKKENAAIFNHPLTWFIQALTILKDGDKAFEHYKKSIPEIVSEDHDVYVLEPYIYSEYITGPAHHQFGRAGHSWLTGTTAWMFYCGTSFILGVKPYYDGLIIEPCIPSSWESYEVIRKFRNSTYRIIVRNPQHKCYGITEVKLDGKLLNTNKLPVFNDNKEHLVEVIM